MHQSWIIGLQGLQLSSQEKQRLRDTPPLGVILFARNTGSAEQTQALLDAVRQHTGQATWAAIDEEGGRVNRMPWPPFCHRKHPAEFGQLFDTNPQHALQESYDDAYRVGLALTDLGFTHNCAPVLDIFHPDGHGIIGQRAFSAKKETIIALAHAVVQGYKAAGIDAVGKHFPGHGRANGDSHLTVPSAHAELPTLLHEADIFSQVAQHGLQHLMSAHVIYPNVSPEIATFSRHWLHTILREHFNFEGTIWSDDLCMRGAGDEIIASLKQAKRAGCDILLICEPQQVANCYQALELGQLS